MNPSKSEVKLDGSELVSFVPMDAVGEYGGIRLDEEKELSEIGGGYTYFCEDDVVVAKITPCFENGKAALAQGLTNGIAFGTTELHVLRANHRCLKPQFLFYLTISDQFRKFGESEMYGAGGQKRVPELFFKNFFTAFPSLDEQQTIACFLDFKTAQIDSLIAKQETLLEKLAEKRTALVSHAVTKGLDPKVEMKDSAVEFLGKIPAHWAVLPLRRLIHTVKTGTTPSGVNQYHFDDEGLDWFRPGDFSDQIFLESAGRRLSEEGVAETRVFPAFTVMHVGIGATIGKVGVALQQGSCNQQINAIVCNDKLHCIFAAYFLRAIREYIVKCGKYTTLPIINQDETKALFFAVPPIDEQIKISDCLLHEEVLIKQQQEKIVVVIDRLREYRAALITNAVSGKIDVRDFAIPRLTVESPCDESEAAWH
jgi:type I restriction enzyme S subunit